MHICSALITRWFGLIHLTLNQYGSSIIEINWSHILNSFFATDLRAGEVCNISSIIQYPPKHIPMKDASPTSVLEQFWAISVTFLQFLADFWHFRCDYQSGLGPVMLDLEHCKQLMSVAVKASTRVTSRVPTRALVLAISVIWISWIDVSLITIKPMVLSLKT